MDRERRDTLQKLAGAAGAAAIPMARPAQAQTVDRLADQVYTKLDPADKPVRGGTLRLAAPLYIGNMNPNRWPVNDWVSLSYFHEKLMVNDGGYMPTVPYIAQSVVRESPKVAMLTLRSGIQFHDGTPLNAEAIKYMFDWIRKPENAAWTIGSLADLESVEVAGPMKVRFNLKHPWAAFEGVLSGAVGYVLSQVALQQDPRRFESTAPKGLGPYTVEEASPGNHLKLKRNPNWWLAKALGRPEMPYFDGIQISVIPDPSVRLANFRAGAIDILSLDKTQYPTVYNDKNFDVHVLPANHSAAYRFNAAKGPCADIRVRKAISHAIDRKALIEGTQFGLARPASGLYPEDHWAHNPTLKPVAFDQKFSRDMLAQAGLEKGVTIRGYVVNTASAVQVAEAVKNMLGQVGINWQVDALAPVAAAARREAGDYDMAAGGWSFVLDPDLSMSGLYHPNGNFSQGRPNDPERLAQIEAARHELSIEKRRTLYQALEKRVVDEYLDAWLWWELSVTAYQKWIRGMSYNGNVRYKESWWFTHPLWFAEGKPGKLG